MTPLRLVPRPLDLAAAPSPERIQPAAAALDRLRDAVSAAVDDCERWGATAEEIAAVLRGAVVAVEVRGG